MSVPQTRVFSADEAGDLAVVVVDHDPGTPRQALLVPADREAATAGVRELAERLRGLPKSIRSALRSATDNAGFLSDDRLQGLAELIQNADDLGATHAHVAVDEVGSRLLFGHNGAGLTLHDVWALAIPWLSLKVAEEDQLGRFGIGLKTLQSLSEVMEVSEGHFDVRLTPDTIEPLEDRVPWPGHPDITPTAMGPLVEPSRGTTFSVPFDPGALAPVDVERWLLQWGESGLVFLRRLSRISLIDANGALVAELQIEHDSEEHVKLAGGETARRTVRAADGRTWLIYARTSQTPEEQVRAGKAQGVATAVALAFPQFDGDTGHLHIGLPVREVGLPFRVSAQFDPQANRRDIAETDWNLALIPMLSDLWLDSVLDMFSTDAPRGWAVVPLTADLDADDRTVGRLRDALESHLMSEARSAFAERVELATDHGPNNRTNRALPKLAMAQLACETIELTDLLSPDDVRNVAESEGALAKAARSVDERWRLVVDDLAELGAPVPVVVDVVEALDLLEDDSRPPEFVAKLVGIAVEEGCTDELAGLPCLFLDDGSRATPHDRTDLDVLLPADAASLWDTLGIGSRLHPAHSDRDNWDQVAQWLVDIDQLRTDASEHAALIILSRAGTEGEELAAPLNDGQLDALRHAVGDLAEKERQRLGPGIGQAIRLSAFTFNSDGDRRLVDARPCDAYLTERDRLAWVVAAAKTPGLMWLDRRYTANLKRDRGSEAIGAQRLFRLLGAESAPRIERHPANFKRYVYHPEGVPRWATGSPSRRNRILTERQATYTVRDWLSRDLDAVLADLAAETDPAQRKRRSEAVLDTITRAWDRLEEFSTVMAAAEAGGWIDKGQVEAWWVSGASSTSAWLTSESGKPATPDALAIRSSVNVVFHGDDPDRYLAPALDTDRLRPVLATLGVAGDPTVPQLLERLEQVRRDTRADPDAAQDQAAPIYQALATEIHGNRLGQLTQTTARSRFGAGEGLVATTAGWRRPSVVLAGPAIFGSLREFVPAVSGTDRLWSFLGVPQPTASDAKAVLKELAKARRDEPMIMLNALRLLNEAPPNVNAPPGPLRRSAVWVGDRWTSERPVYAIANPLIADALRDRIPIWTPGGALNQFNRLIDDYALTRLDAPHGEVQDPDTAGIDEDLTHAFARAVSNLQADLAVSDPETEASLTLPWDTLASFDVAILPELRIRLVESTHGTDETVDLSAWLDIGKQTLYFADETAAGRPSGGGYAIAAAFGGDVRRISHDWVAAWAAAQEGIEAERVITAAQLDAEAKQRRDEASQRLRDLAAKGKSRRKAKRKVEPNASPPSGAGASTETPSPPPTRTLIDPEHFDLENEDGELIVGHGEAGGTPGGGSKSGGGRGNGQGSGGLKDPDRGNPVTKRAGGRGVQNYTGDEREEIGVRLVRRVLGGDEKEVVDIRHQRNVGADAIDDLENFYELKVYSGKIPDDISLTSAEYLRAQETAGFFLVLVGNVEDGEGVPEVLIINDPVAQLTTRPTGSVRLTGRAQSDVLSYKFRRRDLESSNEEES